MALTKTFSIISSLLFLTAVAMIVIDVNLKLGFFLLVISIVITTVQLALKLSNNFLKYSLLSFEGILVIAIFFLIYNTL